MANNLTGNPWVIDTPSGIPIWKTNAKLRHIEFADYAADVDACLVTDQTGRRIFAGNGAADLETVRSGQIGWVDGVVVPSLTAGRVYIYID